MHYGNSKTKYQTEWTSGTGPSTTMSARFVEKADGKVYSFVESTFAYVPNPYGDGVLIEKASGGETSSNRLQLERGDYLEKSGQSRLATTVETKNGRNAQRTDSLLNTTAIHDAAGTPAVFRKK